MEGLRVIINLDLWETSNNFRVKTQGQVAAAVPSRCAYSVPILYPRHDDVHQLREEVVHILAFELCSDADALLALYETPACFSCSHLVGLDSHIRNCLHDHACNVQIR